MLVAGAGHHLERCRIGYGGNDGGSGGGRDGGQLSTITINAQNVELGNTSIGVELIFAYVATEGNTRATRTIGTKGETRRAAHHHVAVVSVEVIAFLALEKHVEPKSIVLFTSTSGNRQIPALIPASKSEKSNEPALAEPRRNAAAAAMVEERFIVVGSL